MLRAASAGDQNTELPCLEVGRIDAVKLLLPFVAATAPGLDNVPPHVTENALAASLERIVHSFDNFTLAVRGVGAFKGVPDVLECKIIPKPPAGIRQPPDANSSSSSSSSTNNQFDFFLLILRQLSHSSSVAEESRNRGKEETVSFECLTLDRVLVTYLQEISQHGKPGELAEAAHEVSFHPNSDLIDNYTVTLPSSVVDATADSVLSADDFCNYATTACPGDLFPYDSLQECYQIMTSLPESCEPRCYHCADSRAPFQGDTRLCRMTYLSIAQMAAPTHCARLRDVSSKCRPEFCPNVVRRPLDEVDKDIEPFDASLPMWMRVLQLISAFILFILPFGTYMIYRRVRRDIRVGQEDARDKRGSALTLFSNTEKSGGGDNLPWLRFAFVMSLPLRNQHCWKKRSTEEEEIGDTVLAADGIDFGGCKMTALIGPSGCGSK